MPVIRLGRRMFLRNAAGGMLAIPFLPSLVSKAWAQASTPPKRFAFIATMLGGHSREAMCPDLTHFNNTATPLSVFGIYNAKKANLTNLVQYRALQSKPGLADNCDQPVFSDPNVVKMTNVYYGMSRTSNAAHSYAACLGDMYDISQGGNNLYTQIPRRITVDEALRQSIYAGGPVPLQPVANLALFHPTRCYQDANFQKRSSLSWIPPTLWQQLLANVQGGGGGGPSTATQVLNRFVSSLLSLEQNPSLSAEDKSRVQSMNGEFSSLASALNNSQGCSVMAQPGSFPTPLSLADREALTTLCARIMAQALICGVTQISTIQLGTAMGVTDANQPQGWHSYSHEPNEPQMDGMIRWHMKTFTAPFIETLYNAIDVDGKRVLENSFVLSVREHGAKQVHGPNQMCNWSWGTLNGQLKANQMLDYTDPNWAPAYGSNVGITQGFLFHSILNAAGVNPTVWGGGSFESSAHYAYLTATAKQHFDRLKPELDLAKGLPGV